MHVGAGQGKAVRMTRIPPPAPATGSIETASFPASISRQIRLSHFLCLGCSVETLCGCQEHEIVRQHPQLDLFLLVDPLAGVQRRAQEPLLPRELALDLPPLAVDAAVFGPAWLAAEPPHHLSPIPRLRPLPARVPPVQGEDRRADTQPLTGQSVVVLGVEDAVTQERVHRAAAPGGPHRRPELWRVLARAAGQVRREEQVAPGLQDRGQLGPGALPPPLVGLLGSPGEVPADVPGLIPGGVDGRLGLGGDQAARPRFGDGLTQEGIDPLFSSRRRAAF